MKTRRTHRTHLPYCTQEMPSSRGRETLSLSCKQEVSSYSRRNLSYLSYLTPPSTVEGINTPSDRLRTYPELWQPKYLIGPSIRWVYSQPSTRHDVTSHRFGLIRICATPSPLSNSQNPEKQPSQRPKNGPFSALKTGFWGPIRGLFLPSVEGIARAPPAWKL